MNQQIDYSLLPPCCNSGCTTCVLDYPELYLETMNESTAAQMTAMLEAMEKAEQQLAETEDFQWTNNANKN
jgi:uncharacterized protein YfeS